MGFGRTQDETVPLLAGSARQHNTSRSSVPAVAGAIACCGLASASLAWVASETSARTVTELAEVENPVLPVRSLDFWMGVLLRLLAAAAVVLAIVEVRLPKCERKKTSPESDLEAKLLPEKTSTPSKLSEVYAYCESGFLILAYMAASIGIVYLNAFILKEWPYAATLTMLQMTFCSLASHACVAFGLSDPSKVGMTWRLYVTICAPLAVLYTFYLYGSNAVYNFLPVGYIQLLKPAQAIAVYVLLAAAGCEIVAPAPILNLAVILGSVVIASVAQSEIAGWSTIGFVLMMVSNAAYACYLVGQQLLLNARLGDGKKSVKMDSITTLYFLGPATAVGLATVAFANEWRSKHFSFSGMPVLLLVGDCFIAFSLNLIQIRIIGKLSALAYMFAGYVKGFLTVAISWVFYHEAVDSLEIGGYIVMLFGQLLWSLRKLRQRADKEAAAAADAADPNAPHKAHDTKATVKTNAAVAATALLAFLLYAATRDACVLLPCRTH